MKLSIADSASKSKLTRSAGTRLLTAPAPDSAAFESAVSRQRDGTRLDYAAVRDALGLRLGGAVAAAGICEWSTQLDPAKITHSLATFTARNAQNRALNLALRSFLSRSSLAALQKLSQIAKKLGRPKGTYVRFIERAGAYGQSGKGQCPPNFLMLLHKLCIWLMGWTFTLLSLDT